MDRKQVMQWVRDASVGDGSELSGDAVETFAAIVWNAALERATEVCEEQVPRYYGGNMESFRQCAAAIRALKQPTEASNG